MNPTVKIEGFVANTADCGESDRMLTLITRQYGKMSVYARGGRKLSSKFMTASLKFCYGEYVISKSEKGSILHEANAKMTFFGLRKDMVSLALADYIAEVTSDVTMPEVPDEEILDLALNSIYLLSEQKRSAKNVKCAFEIRLAEHLGLAPDVENCSECGKNKAEWYYLDIMNGTAVCLECARKHESVNEVYEDGTARIVALMNKDVKEYIYRVQKCEKSKIFAPPKNEDILRQAAEISEKYLINQLERSYKTLDFYKEISKL